MFDCRVRDGNGSDHCGITTKLCMHGFDVQKIDKEQLRIFRPFSENYI
jgi:hypothetical protein